MFAKSPVNLSGQMIFVAIASILGPVMHIVSTMDFFVETFGFVPRISVIPLLLNCLIMIPFILIRQIKKGILLFPLLYVSPIVLMYFALTFVAILTHDVNMPQSAVSTLRYVSLFGMIGIIGMVIMYYVHGWSEKWNEKFEKLMG